MRHALPRLVPCSPAATSTRLALGQDGHVRLWRQTRFALPFPPRPCPCPSPAPVPPCSVCITVVLSPNPDPKQAEESCLPLAADASLKTTFTLAADLATTTTLVPPSPSPPPTFPPAALAALAAHAHAARRGEPPRRRVPSLAALAVLTAAAFPPAALALSRFILSYQTWTREAPTPEWLNPEPARQFSASSSRPRSSDTCAGQRVAAMGIVRPMRPKTRSCRAAVKRLSGSGVEKMLNNKKCEKSLQQGLYSISFGPPPFFSCARAHISSRALSQKAVA